MIRQTGIFATALAVFLLSGICHAQSKQSETNTDFDKKLAEMEEKLDALSKERAGEYLDVQERLYDVLDEYSDYMKVLAKDAEFEGELSIQKMKKRIRDGAYADEPEKLLDDIYALIDEIKPLESQLQIKYHSNEPKEARLLRNFRRDLIIVAELVEDYTDQQMTQFFKQIEVSEYVKTSLEAALKALGQVDIPPMPAIPIAPAPPDVPALPRVEPRPAPDVPDQQERIEQWRKASGTRSGRMQTYQANLTIGSSKRPIIIDNTLGDVTITGWNDGEVSAILGIEVSASSGEKEKDFISRSKLRVETNSDGYYVYSTLPSISDVRTEVLRSTLEVNVPIGNKIICRSSYGDVAVQDLENGLEITGDNCQVRLDNVRGPIVVTNKKGSITITDGRGDLNLSSGYAPVMVDGCDGKMIVENTNGPVTVTDSRGSLTIRSTGQIIVNEYEGDVSIDNRNGEVSVVEVRGGVIARNAYQSLTINDVQGEVSASNSYGTIALSDISGIISSDNTAGATLLETVTGPINVTSRIGSVTLMLDDSFHGRSSVISNSGSIQIQIANQPDLVLLVHTTGGTINSNLPIKVYSEGAKRSAELVLGDGGETLEISGSNSTISISGRY